MKIRYPHKLILAAATFCSFVSYSQERIGATTTQTNADGVVWDKYLTVDDAADHKYILNLEAYVTGVSQQTASDIVLVLDNSQSMQYSYVRINHKQYTRLELMKIAAKSFVDIVYKKNPSEQCHKLAVVTFNGSAKTCYPTSDDLAEVKDNETVADIQSAIDGIGFGGGTVPEYGLQRAYNILCKYSDDKRPKTVVFFTDGCPTIHDGEEGYNEKTKYFDPQRANDAIDEANSLKNDLNATVYSVALLAKDEIDGTADPGIYDGKLWIMARRFLHYVSSNYSNKHDVTVAQFQSTSGDGSEAQHDFLSMTTGSDLTDIFNQIATASSKGGTRITLGDDSIVKDVITADFALQYPDDATEIKTSVWKVSGYSNGTYSWAEDKAYSDASKIDVSISGDNKNTIQVTGFDFTKADTYTGSTINTYGNWVGDRSTSVETTDYHGRKLVVTIPITTSTDFEGGIDIPTNESSSGIYSGGKSVVTFPIPKLDYMYIGIVKTGLAKGESATFTVRRTKDKDGKSVTDDPYTVVLTGTGSAIPPYAVIKDVPDGTYTVSESTWAWSYDQKTTPLTKSFTTDGTSTWPYDIVETVKPLLFVFENTTKGLDQTTYAEAAVKNTFKGGTVTTSSHDPVQSKPKE